MPNRKSLQEFGSNFQQRENSMGQRLCQLSRPPFLGILDPWSNFCGQNILSHKLSHLSSILIALGENIVASMIFSFTDSLKDTPPGRV